MKSKFLCLVLTLLTVISGFTFVGCTNPADMPVVRDYNEDIKQVEPENIDVEHFIPQENTTYYTSPGFSLWMEVNGAFLKMDYFYLDGNKRVYDNLYFYVDDYFYIVTDDYKDLYASLSDSADLEYAEEEKEQGYDIQINVKKAGIYKLIFDLTTLKFDMEYKAEIQSPVYYTIKNCSIYTPATNWVEMSVNPENADEFVINNFAIEKDAYVCFFNFVHTSNYKVTTEAGLDGKITSGSGSIVYALIGGNYNVYINKKTYVVRFELLNPENADYSCVYYDGNDFIELEPYEEGLPYIFRHRIVVDTNNSTSVPKFYTSKYKTYSLTVAPSDLLFVSAKNNHYFKQAGTYELIINLKTFEITVERVTE